MRLERARSSDPTRWRPYCYGRADAPVSNWPFVWPRSVLDARQPQGQAPMDTPWWIRLACVGVGALLMFRAVVLVTLGSDGRFRGDVWLSIVAAFALFLIGAYVLAG